MHKTVTTLALALLSTLCAHAQTTNCDSLQKTAKAQKTVGILCAVTGPIEVIAGSVMLGIGIGSLQPATSPTVDNTDAYINIALGSVFAVAGTVFTCLAPVYFDKHKQTKAALKNCGTGAYLKPFVTGSSTSASAGMRITF